jgi:hypothetical protein
MKEGVGALGSSRSSEPPKPSTPPRVPPRTARALFYGHRGGAIAVHRALVRLDETPGELIVALVTGPLVSAAWIASLRCICRIWSHLLAKGIAILGLDAQFAVRPYHFTRYVGFEVPYLRMEAVAPDATTWWSTLLVVAFLYAMSCLFSEKLTPLLYLLRAMLLVQLSALGYFLVAPARFPHTPDGYTEGLVSSQIALIAVVPLLFALTYHIFEFSLAKKIALTLLTMAYISVFVPVQLLLQGMVLEKSVLFMPVLYLVFGLPLDVFIILAFYSWGMSWQTRDAATRA